MESNTKKYRIPGHEIRQLIPNTTGCIASDRITVDGLKVSFMYREEPRNDVDSGWVFLSGEESQEYADNPANWEIHALNTVCNYDPSVIPYLGSNPGTAFGRAEGTDNFEEEEFQNEQA